MDPLTSRISLPDGTKSAPTKAEDLNMLIFWGYLGWSIVALTGLAYVWFIYRVLLFPKPAKTAGEDKPRLAA
jgi:choline-glycine betaine transporter